MPKTTAISAPGEVADLIRTALSKGQLLVLRASSQPQDDAQTSLHFKFNRLFKLTPSQSWALAALLEREHVTRAEMHCAMAHDGTPVSNIKTIDVILSKMRSKLASHDIEVVTVHGVGFALAEGAHDKINRLLAELATAPPAEPAAVPPD